MNAPVDPDRLVGYLKNEAGRPLKAKELANALDVPQSDYKEFKELLGRLEDEGRLYRVKKQRYAVPAKINLAVGRLQSIRSGAAFLIPDSGDTDVFVPPHALESAVDGDRVVVRIERKRRGEKPQGRVIKVLERAREQVVGVYHGARNFGFVDPDDRKLPRDIFVPPDDTAGAKDGDVVVVEIGFWGDEKLSPSGRITEVLGRRGEPGVDVLSIVHGHELPLGFPPDVEAQARALHESGIGPADLKGREDLRDLLVFTIDPEDARDHDDALSVTATGEDEWEVGVHIADVAHYVEEGGAIDAEALRRGTSVYLVDRVVPMLPEELSGDLCSLRPDVDRLALSAMIRLGSDGSVRGSRIARTVIRSRHRLSYEEAQRFLDGERSDPAEVSDALDLLVKLSRGVRAARARRGSIDFDLPEARVVLNREGEPTDIQRVLRLEAHRLIEDFMILANETVATRASKKKIPFIYRIHEPPDEDRVQQLSEFLGTLGVKFKPSQDPKAFQAAIESVEGRPEEHLVSTALLRSMKQARYSVENKGHFGLASTHYAHFTSPIRRYPDLVVHRLTARAFVDEERIPREETSRLEDVALHCSQRERVAVSAERDSVDMKKVEFMERHLGEEFDGTISGVTSFGFFVLLDRFFVEGLVHVNALEDDYYVFMDEQYSLIGENSKRRFRLGDRVRIQVAAVDRDQRQVDLVLAESGQRKSRGGRGRKRPEKV